MNKWFGIGRLTQDPDVKMVGEHKVANFTLAINRRTNKDHPEADFIECAAWRTMAEFVEKYAKKGMKFAVIGNLQTRSYEDKEGNKRKAYSILVDDMEFTEPKGSSNNISVEEEDDLPI